MESWGREHVIEGGEMGPGTASLGLKYLDFSVPSPLILIDTANPSLYQSQNLDLAPTLSGLERTWDSNKAHSRMGRTQIPI